MNVAKIHGKPRPGDHALHKSNQLDSREVAVVSDDGTQIRLQIGTLITPWISADNYTYTRIEE